MWPCCGLSLLLRQDESAGRTRRSISLTTVVFVVDIRFDHVIYNPEIRIMSYPYISVSGLINEVEPVFSYCPFSSVISHRTHTKNEVLSEV